jgi:hypothetical protein
MCSMKSGYTLLRLAVLTGCLLLIIGGPRVWRVRAHTEDCVRMQENPNQPCPSGCTLSSYNYWYLVGTGFTYSDYNPAPCGSAQQGKTCSQAEEYDPPQNEQCSTCCLNTGQCSSTECNGNDPCCGTARCTNGQCCVANGALCTALQVCCYENCLSGFCQNCAYLGQPCNVNANNCCDGTQCSMYTSKCCLAIGQTCSGVGIGDVDCCSGHCADRYGKCICVS